MVTSITDAPSAFGVADILHVSSRGPFFFVAQWKREAAHRAVLLAASSPTCLAMGC
jgi:hypothetical protein